MKEAAFFDLDGTMVIRHTEKVFCRRLFFQGLLPLSGMLRVMWIFMKYHWGIVKNYDDIKRSLLKNLLKGVENDTVLGKFEECFHEDLMRAIAPGARQEIDRHHEEGREVIVISASLDFIVERLCREMGLNRYYATGLETRNGVLTGNVDGPIYYGETKRTLLHRLASEEHIDLNSSYAYGDSIQDAPMLAAVGNPCAVNPDGRLRHLALERNWQLTTWDVA